MRRAARLFGVPTKNGRKETEDLGTFPHTCSRCGVTFESVEELADPKNHDWPNGSAPRRNDVTADANQQQ
jgi:predicted nucleic acid-binding Zn ribbon protein